jgi:hypothetical protein
MARINSGMARLFSRSLLFGCLGVVFSASVGAAPVDKPASRATPLAPPLVVPAVLDAVTFEMRMDGESHKMVVMTAPGQMRVDEPTDGYSILYRSAAQFYIGLEHRNYTYWEFSWPGVKDAIENTQRYETRVKDLGTQGLNGYLPDSETPAGGGVSAGAIPEDASMAGADAAATNAAAAAPEGQVSGYVWKPTTEKKRIAGLECVRWTGESVSNDPVEAWCYPGALPKVQAALAAVRAINEPMALVPVRTLVPPFVFEVEDDLQKGGVTPVLISWGSDQEKNRFGLVSVKTREGEAKLFTVPPLYVKTTLVTMDGIGSQKVEGKISQPQTPEKVPRDDNKAGLDERSGQ